MLTGGDNGPYKSRDQTVDGQTTKGQRKLMTPQIEPYRSNDVPPSDCADTRLILTDFTVFEWKRRKRKTIPKRLAPMHPLQRNRVPLYNRKRKQKGIANHRFLQTNKGTQWTRRHFTLLACTGRSCYAIGTSWETRRLINTTPQNWGSVVSNKASNLYNARRDGEVY